MIEFGINYRVDDVLWVQAINAEFTSVSFPAYLTCRTILANHLDVGPSR